jgi:LL-diaminopimelate aminotransferase
VLQARDEKIRQGVDVIDLGVGNPDMRPPREAIETLKAALDDPRVQNHRYPSFNGLPEFRAAITSWYQRRFGVTLDPAREALALVGSKEGIFKFFLSHFDPGDTLLLCTPCYPAYLGQAAIAGVRKVEVPLLAKNRFVPDLSAIPTDEARRAKAIAINFPNNPTAATETAALYQDILQLPTSAAERPPQQNAHLAVVVNHESLAMGIPRPTYFASHLGHDKRIVSKEIHHDTPIQPTSG